MAKNRWITFLFISFSFVISSLDSEVLAQGKSEKVRRDTAVKRFPLEDGQYVGAHHHQKTKPNKKVSKSKVKKKEKVQKRYDLQEGTDIGAGARYRKGKAQSSSQDAKAKNKTKKEKDISQKGRSYKSGSNTQKRYPLQNGSFVGAGPKKPKKKD